MLIRRHLPGVQDKRMPIFEHRDFLNGQFAERA
jgi:hypothetical protein